MESKDAYRIEEIRLKVAEAQKEANSMLLKAKEKELEIEKGRNKEKEEITKTYKYLLDCNFGDAFYLSYSLKNKKTTESLLKDFEFILSFIDSSSTLNALYNGKKGSLDSDAKDIAHNFFDTYNKFISLGHPGYELIKKTVCFDNVLSCERLYLMKETRLELEQLFIKQLNAGADRLFELYNLEKVKKDKIAEAKKVLAENPE